MILTTGLVSFSVLLYTLALVILFITVLPKQYKEMRLFPKDKITAMIFYAKTSVALIEVFLWILGAVYLLDPKPIKALIFLYAYVATALAAMINSVLWYHIYNIRTGFPAPSHPEQIR